MLILNVPYAQKEEAKALGARWYPEGKKWVVYSKKYNDIIKFRKWLDGSFIIRNELYIVEGKRVCWKCKKETPVICLAFKDYINLDFPEIRGDSFILTSMLSELPCEIFNYMTKKYFFKMTYSRTRNEMYCANCCINCNCIQGEFHLFEEFLDSPFYPMTEDSARELTFNRIKLPFDFSTEFEAYLDFSEDDGLAISPNDLVNKYSKFEELNLFNQVN